MRASELRAIASCAIPLLVAEVADVVKEAADDCELRSLRSEPVDALDRLLVTRDEPCRCKGHVERVLHVVIRRVDREIALVSSVEQTIEIVESQPDRIEARVVIKGFVNALDRATHA